MLNLNNNNALAVVTVCGVRGYLDNNGTAHINLEDAARGLGFTQTKNGMDYVRWETVSRYLKEFSQLAGKVYKTEQCETVSEGDLPEFIPENIFYKLCFKANNKIAREFQDAVTDEVLPTIRKHGMYATPDKIEALLADPDTLIVTLQTLKAEREARKALEAKVEQDAPKVLFADAVSASENTILVEGLAAFLKQNGLDIGRTRLFERLRQEGYLKKAPKDERNNPTQRALKMKLFEVSEFTIQRANKPPLVKRTTRVTGKGQQYFLNKYLNTAM